MQIIREISNSLKAKNTKSGNTKNIERMKQFLLDLPNIDECQFIDSQTSSVSTKWGVAWSEFAIVRDYLQNF